MPIESLTHGRLQLGPDVEVLAPPELREQVVADPHASLQRYAGGSVGDGSAGGEAGDNSG